MLLYEKPFRLEVLGNRLYKDEKELPFSVRKVSDLKDVLMDPSKMGPDGDAYFMFRDVFSRPPLRFDITILVPRLYGDECNKTFGHTHPKSPSGVPYPELYQVLRGEAFFMLQKRNRDDTYDCLHVEAKEGDIVLIPPNYGHVSVNRSTTSQLILSNIVSSSFDSVYGEFRENRGAAFYYTKFGPVQNMHCMVRKSEKAAPRQILKMYGVVVGDLLETVVEYPEKLEFLGDPSKLPQSP